MQHSTENTGPVAGGSAPGADAHPETGPGSTSSRGAAGTVGVARAGAARRRPSKRRVSVWVFIVVGVLLVALAGTAALLMSNRGGGTAPEAEVVTLPVPTPTIDPIDRQAGSAFYDALPSTVLDFALSDSVDASELTVQGALEGYRLAYTNGSATVTLLAGQWATSEAADAAWAALSGSATQADAGTASPEPSDGASSADPVEAATGEVTVGGTVVGTYTMAATEDGDGTLTWSNDTVVLQLAGPADELRDLYAGFPL